MYSVISSYFKHCLENIWDILFPYKDTDLSLFGHEDSFQVHITTQLLNIGSLNQNYPVISLSDYSNKSVARVIHAFKYHKDARAITLLASCLGDYLLETLTESFQVYPNQSISIIGVPLSSQRYKERGFNQIDTLLQEVCLLYPEVLKYIKKDFLIKDRETRSQTHLTRKERLRNLIGAFSCTDSVTGTVYLIDDVVSTGATVFEASQVLTQAGAVNVVIITLARKV